MSKQISRIIVLVAMIAIGCGSSRTHVSKDVVNSDPETKKMSERLKLLVEEGDPLHHYHWNTQLAEYFKFQLEIVPEKERDYIWYMYCFQLLHSGQTEAAIEELESRIPSDDKELKEWLVPGKRPMVELLALSYLRLGEVQNCQENHTASSCIVPFQEEAFHELQLGSRKAIKLFTFIQKHSPSDKTKWLLNLAYMTLGLHPQEVPKDWLLEFPSPHLETSDFPRFQNIANDVGLAIDGLSGGVCLEDFNNDGFVDIFATSYGMEDQVRLYFHDTKGGYHEVTESAGLTGIISGLNCIHADYNNDGFEDILVLRGGWLGKGGEHPNSLLRNNGDGTFTDVTESSGMLSFHPTQTAAWADINRDGWLDLFIGNESTESPHPCELYINQGDGTFVESAAEHGLGDLTFFAKGTCFGDINNDSWPDLFVSALGGNNRLFHNLNGQFTEIAEIAGVQQPKYSFPCWFWDVNHDGLDDIFVSGYDTRDLDNLARDYSKELQRKTVGSAIPRLYLNNGDFTFTDRTKEYGLNKTMYSMGANFGDLDNDGFLDFYVGTGAPHFSALVPNRMFRNVNGERFEEVTSAGGFGHLQKGHGVGFADMDNDGDQDIYAVMGGAYEGDTFVNALFENPSTKNNWIIIDLEGVTINRSAIGARIKLELADGRQIYHTIGTGGSFGSSSLQAEIGLGENELIEQITVFWDVVKQQKFSHVPVNRKYRLKQGEELIPIEDFKEMPWNKDHGGHHHH